MNRITEIKLWFCSIFLVLLTACAGKADNVPKYPIMVVAGRGQWLFGHRVVYAVDEFGNQLSLDLPKEEYLGSDPAWSPDGRWIAHSYNNPNARSASDYDIYVMDVSDAFKNIRATYNLTFPLSPAWAPDGTQIALSAYSHDITSHYGIFLLNVECIWQGKNCNPKPTLLVPGMYPDWSPNGKKIVYMDVTDRQIRVVDVHNPNDVVVVSQGLKDCNSPQWSPDGNRIAFVCGETLYTADPDGGNHVNLVNGANFYLKWTPDGKKIAFIGTKTLDPNLGKILDLEGTVRSEAVFMMDANGANLTRITKSNEESIGSFTWIPINRIKTAP